MISKFQSFVKIIIEALPRTYGIQPVAEAMEHAVGLSPYSGDRHGLAKSLTHIVALAESEQKQVASNLDFMFKQFDALAFNYEKHTLEQLYQSCSIITEDLHAFKKGDETLNDLLRQVMSHLENKI